jgi:hypothetical protein
MVLGTPRSGTAWVANWLTTDRTLCLHDPLWTHHYSELDQMLFPGRRVGVACTGLALFPQYLEKHPARKVILHRPIEEVNASLTQMGMPALGEAWDGALDRIQGMHVPWTDVLNPDRADEIHQFLLRRRLDTDRHAMLTRFNVQMAFEKIVPDRSAIRRLLSEFHTYGGRRPQ